MEREQQKNELLNLVRQLKTLMLTRKEKNLNLKQMTPQERKEYNKQQNKKTQQKSRDKIKIQKRMLQLGEQLKVDMSKIIDESKQKNKGKKKEIQPLYQQVHFEEKKEQEEIEEEHKQQPQKQQPQKQQPQKQQPQKQQPQKQQPQKQQPQKQQPQKFSIKRIQQELVKYKFKQHDYQKISQKLDIPVEQLKKMRKQEKQLQQQKKYYEQHKEQVKEKQKQKYQQNKKEKQLEKKFEEFKQRQEQNKQRMEQLQQRKKQFEEKKRQREQKNEDIKQLKKQFEEKKRQREQKNEDIKQLKKQNDRAMIKKLREEQKERFEKKYQQLEKKQTNYEKLLQQHQSRKEKLENFKQQIIKSDKLTEIQRKKYLKKITDKLDKLKKGRQQLKILKKQKQIERRRLRYDIDRDNQQDYDSFDELYEYFQMQNEDEDEYDIYEDLGFEDSSTVQQKQLKIQDDDDLSEPQKERLLSMTWTKYNQLQILKSQKERRLQEHQQMQQFRNQNDEEFAFGKKRYSRSGNNNIFVIREFQDDKIFIPTHDQCFFKCLHFVYKDNDEILNQIEQFKLTEYKNFIDRHALSSKKAIKFLKQLEQQFPQQVRIKYQKKSRIIRSNENLQQKRIGTQKYLLIKLEGHYCVILNNQMKENGIKCLTYLQQQKEQNPQFMNQDFKELIKRKINIAKDIETEQNEQTIETEQNEQTIEENKQEAIQNSKRRLLFFADIESYQQDKFSMQQPFLIGYQSIVTNINEMSEEIDEERNNITKKCFAENPQVLIKAFFQYLLQEMKRNDIKQSYLMFHNGQNYDNHIIYNNLPINLTFKKTMIKGNSIIFEITERDKGKYGKKIILIDTIKIVGSSLKQISFDYKLKNKKQESECIKNVKTYQEYLENKKEIDKYFVKDILSLTEFYTKVRNFFIDKFDEDILKKNTIGQLALSVYRNKFDTDKINHYAYFFNNVYQNEHIRMFIRGGRTNCMKQYFKSSGKEYLYYYDATSLYPSSMVKIEKELGGYYILDQKTRALENSQFQEIQDKMNNKQYQNYLNEFMLIICDIKIPQGNFFLTNYIRFNDEMNNQKTGYFTGTFHDQYFTSWDLYQLIIHNKIEILKIHQCIKMNTKIKTKLDVMMQQLKNQRTEFKEQGNTVGQLMIKTIMNSIYGKQIQKFIYKEHKLKETQTDTIQTVEVIQYDEDRYLHCIEKIEVEKQFNCSNVVIALQTLAMSKIIINQFVEKFDGFRNQEMCPFYTDTDSVIINQKAHEIIVNDYQYLIGDDFGQMKLEKILKYFRCFGKKFYEYEGVDDGHFKFDKEKKEYIFDQKDFHYDSRIKGLHLERNVDQKDKMLTEKAQSTSKKIFFKLQRGEDYDCQQTKFTRDYKQRKLTVTKEPKKLKTTYNFATDLTDNQYIPFHLEFINQTA